MSPRFWMAAQGPWLHCLVAEKWRHGLPFCGCQWRDSQVARWSCCMAVQRLAWRSFLMGKMALRLAAQMVARLSFWSGWMAVTWWRRQAGGLLCGMADT